ncbi:MAG: hypothetical protein R6U89_10000 [Dehalococcoidia bacterium]
MMKEIPGGSAFVVLIDLDAARDISLFTAEELEDMGEDEMWEELGISFEQVDAIGVASYAGPMYIYGKFRVSSVREHLKSNGYERIERENIEMWSDGIRWTALTDDYVVAGDQLVPPASYEFVNEVDRSLYDSEHIQETILGLKECPYVILLQGLNEVAVQGPLVAGIAVCEGGEKMRSKVLAIYDNTEAAKLGMQSIAVNLDDLKDDDPDMEIDITMEGRFVEAVAEGDVQSFWQAVFSALE